MAPAIDSTTLSTSTPRTSLTRPAPSAVRIASSRLRPSARVSTRFATLTHTIRRTKPTAPSNRNSGVRTSPTSALRISCTAIRPLRFVLGYCSARRTPSGSHLLARSIDRRLRFQPGDHVQVMRAALGGQFVGGEALREPDLRLQRVGESARHDSDDAVLVSVDRDGTTHGLRVAAKPPGPQRVAEHDHVRAANRIIVDGEGAAIERSDTKYGEETAGDGGTGHLFRGTDAGQRVRAGVDCRHLREARAVAAPVDEVGRRRRATRKVGVL